MNPASTPKTTKTGKKKNKSACPAAETDRHIQNLERTINAYEHRMCGSAAGCVDRYLELAKVNICTLKRVGTPCLDDHLFSPEDLTNKGELNHVASKIVLKCLYLARLARPDLLWSVNTLAREVTKWSVACDKRLHRLISYIHHTRDHTML